MGTTRGAALIASGLVFVGICALASYTRTYLSYPWIDLPLHFAFGVWLTLLLLHYGYGGTVRVVLAVMLIGVAWEFTEYGFDSFVAQPLDMPLAQHGWPDTLSDTLTNFLGAALGAMVSQRRMRV